MPKRQMGNDVQLPHSNQDPIPSYVKNPNRGFGAKNVLLEQLVVMLRRTVAKYILGIVVSWVIHITWASPEQ